MFQPIASLGVALLAATTALAYDPPTCGLDKRCPKETPCCSQYNQCGVGAFCLGGCDPRMSFSIDSCMPAPVCQDKTLRTDTLDRYKNHLEYLGDPKDVDWVGQGEPKIYNGDMLLTMAPRTVGTVLASTTYMWYGTVKAKIKTGIGKGVVTAFILFSDVKDEIDYEWVGVDLNQVQTNYYFQGITDYTNTGNTTGLSNTYENWHEYEIRWTPEEVKWIVDGVERRSKKKSETWNSTSNQWGFPQTPSRVQISIWPGGLETNAEGTVNWAGGVIDWQSDYIKKNGYYFAAFKDVKVECYKTDKAPGTNKGKSYYYNSIIGTNDTVVDSNKRTTLKSMAASGLDMDKDLDGLQDGAQFVPGGMGTGNLGGSNTKGGSGGSGTGTAADCKTTGFSQRCGSAQGSNSGGARGADRTVGPSALAAIIGFIGLFLL